MENRLIFSPTGSELQAGDTALPDGATGRPRPSDGNQDCLKQKSK